MHKLQKGFMDNLTNTALIASSTRGAKVIKLKTFCQNTLNSQCNTERATFNSKVLRELQAVRSWTGKLLVFALSV